MKDEKADVPTQKSPKETFRRIRVVGMVTAIPMMMVAGPVVGCFMGYLVVEAFGKLLGPKQWFGSTVADMLIVCFALLGFVAGIAQSIKVIKLVGKYQNED